MTPRRFYQGLTLVILLHLTLLFCLFHDKILLLSAVSVSLGEPDTADRHEMLRELEVMWEEQVIEDLFKGDSGEPADRLVTELRVNPAPPRGVRERMDDVYLVTRAEEPVTLEPASEGTKEERTLSGDQPKIGADHDSEDQIQVEDMGNRLEPAARPHTASQPEPTAAKPEPTAAKPEPTAAKPEPTAAKPEPTAAKPEPTAAKPEPTAAKAEPTARQAVKPGPADKLPDNVGNETPAPAKPSLGRPKMVLVLTESRHGSTWLMDVLSWPSHHVPVFEPLNLRFLRMYAQDDDVRAQALADGYDLEKFPDWREVTLTRICKCDWYGNMIPGKNDRIFGSIVGMAYKAKRLGIDYRRSYKESQEMCQAKDALMVPKTIRLYDISTFHKLSEFGCPGFKIIHLVRDPRAVILSRMLVFHELYDGNKLLGPHLLTSNQAIFPDEYVKRAAGDLCSHHLQNYQLGLNPPAWLEGRYIMIRYEDLAKSPDQEFRDLLQFAGIPYTTAYQDYVYNTTHLVDRGIARRGGNYDVDRETSSLIDKWRGKLIERHWRNIEEVCAEMMKTFDYKFDYYEE